MVGKILLNDAQTSGGLVIAINNKKKENLIEELKKRGVTTAVYIGDIVAKGSGKINVL